MKKIFAIALFTLSMSMGASALSIKPDWLQYPSYADREEWKKIAGSNQDYLIKAGEEYLNYKWQPIHASVYLEYAKTGNTELLAQEEMNRKALNALVVAELVEGKGRFIMQIADILWLETTRFSWSRPQAAEGNTSKSYLPVSGDKSFTPGALENAVSIAVAYNFFKEEIDKLDPSICRMVHKAMEKNISLEQALSQGVIGKEDIKKYLDFLPDLVLVSL